MTACPNAHSKRTPFVALRHVHAKLLYGGGMRGCLRVYDGIPAGAGSAAETWQLIPAAKCRPKSGCKDALDLPLFFCLALRRSQYLRHQCSAGFPPSARSACPHRARRNRKAAQPSTDAQSLRAPPGGRRGRPFWEGNNGTFPHQPFLRPYGDKVFNSSSPVTPSCASSLANGIRSSASPSTL